jgi:hypothetical protein
MGFRERVFARRAARPQTQAEAIINGAITVAFLLLVVAALLAIGMHYF